MTNKILQCDLHDYLEIACMFHYRVELILDTGEVISGVANDTKINECKQELLELQGTTEAGQEMSLSIPVLSLRKLTVLTEGARFKEVTFN